VTSRCTGPEILALLETKTVQKRFDIDDQGLGRIRNWVQQTGICWGLDSEHRSELGIEQSNLNTWSFGLDRMLLGYLTGPLEDPYKGILPWSGIRDSEAQWLGSLVTLLEQLRQLRQTFSEKHRPNTWCLLLHQLVNDFFLPDNSDKDQESATTLRETITSLGESCSVAGFSKRIDLTIIQSFLKESLGKSFGGQSFLTGRVTFCNMVPMRSIPFRVICLLGMNDADYPRSQHPPSFDLMGEKPMIGDRNRRNDDRYLFLESLLSARDTFYISWVGRSQSDNSTLPPSVVIDEVKNYINRSCSPDSSSPCDQLSTEYPLQPFSSRCFDPTSPAWSYAGEWMPPGTGRKTEAVFLPEPLEPADAKWKQVDIRTFARFWSHPVRFFLQERIGLQLWENDENIPESEPFELNHLEQYTLGQDITQAQLNQENPERTYLHLQSSGILPHNNFGVNLFQEIQDKLRPFSSQLADLLIQPLEPYEIKTNIGSFSINGWLDNLHSGGRIHYRNTKLKARDLLQLWIYHLILNCVQPQDCSLLSIHVATDRTVLLHPIQNPEKELKQLLDLYFEGLSHPLHFYPETSWAWCKEADGKKAQAAETRWNGGYWQKGEKDDIAYKIGLRNDSALDPKFIELSQILDPLFIHLEE